ncbi:helix-turn-helix domain-containing protein [Streptomyces sp. bgisy159]|uniref:helix-turn-helix domain-containing protein n=1 Tax=Streptomyces sp. bgisy159 TaxID=3413795 RepID=UPI003F4A4B4A
MGRRKQPTARQLRLGLELRKLREAAGLKGLEAAALLGADSVQISQIESGIAGVSEERVRRLAAHYSCTDAELIEALAAMATDRTRGWWEEYRERLPTSFLDLSELEHHATHRWDVELLYVPGLLQTEDYARMLFSSRVPELPRTEIELRVQHRTRRRGILQGPKPVPYTAVVHESALRMRVGGRSTLRAQLAHLLEASEADHVTVRAIPFETDSFTPLGSTIVYAGGDIPKLDTVVQDAPHGTVFIDAEAQLGVFRTLLRRVEAASLDPERSRDFIHRVAKEL